MLGHFPWIVKPPRLKIGWGAKDCIYPVLLTFLTRHVCCEFLYILLLSSLLSQFLWSAMQRYPLFSTFTLTILKTEMTMEVLNANANANAKSLQSCPTLCDPIDGSPPGSAVPGLLQARILEWVAISFSNAWKRKVKVKSLIRVRLLATPWTTAYQAPLSMDFPGKSTGVGCHCLLRSFS